MKNFMKIIVAVAMLLGISQSVRAQFSNNTEPDRFHMNIHAGISMNTFTGDNSDGIKAFSFPTGGLSWDFQVAPDPIFVSVGLNYFNYGFKVEGTSEWEDWDGNLIKATYSEKRDKESSIQVPVTASYHINAASNLFINPFLGGFVAYNLEDTWDKQVNYGLRVGCGMNYGRFTFDIGYDLGIANLGTSKSKSHSGTFFATVGFNVIGNR